MMKKVRKETTEMMMLVVELLRGKEIQLGLEMMMIGERVKKMSDGKEMVFDGMEKKKKE